MTYRSKAGLRTLLSARVADAPDGNISAPDVREVLGDMIDSLAPGVEPLSDWWYQAIDASEDQTDEAAFRANAIRVQGHRSVDAVPAEWGADVPTGAQVYFWFLLPVAWLPLTAQPTILGSPIPISVQSQGYQIGGEEYALMRNAQALSYAALAVFRGGRLVLLPG